MTAVTTELVYTSINPASATLVAEFPCIDDAELEEALRRADCAFADWRRRSFSERACIVRAFSDQCQRAKEYLAHLLSEEVGKPLSQARMEVQRCIDWPLFFADQSQRLLAPERSALVQERELVLRHDPLGPLFAILPWNFPASLAVRSAIPSLMAGNPVILKPAPNVPRVSLALRELAARAEFPEGVLQILFLSNQQAQRVIQDRRIRAVSFTGSLEVGREIGKLAGQALKKASLELGGNDPFVVFADADIERAAQDAFAARISNAGQVCCCPKRFLVQKEIEQPFLEALAPMLKGLTVGDPLDERVQMGPLARNDLTHKLRQQLQQAYAQGARCLATSFCPQGPGFFHPALLLADVGASSVVFFSELFGPIFPVTSFKDEAQALALVNASNYGLNASLYSASRARLERLVPLIDAGTIGLNCVPGVDPRIPFGGVKDSGFGRAYGREGLQESCGVKAVLWSAS